MTDLELNAMRDLDLSKTFVDDPDWTVERALRLLAERDAAMKHASQMTCFVCGKPWSVEADAETCGQAHRETWGHEWVSPRVNELTARLLKANEEKDALARFKAWVHDYLDGKGIPTHPDGLHSQRGCRIGDRLDLVFAELRARATAEGGTSGKEGGA